MEKMDYTSLEIKDIDNKTIVPDLTALKLLCEAYPIHALEYATEQLKK
jgi:hypothetical protein